MTAHLQEDFPHWSEEIVRISDLDFQMHVNNSVYSAYLGNARYNFLSDHVRPHLDLEAAMMVVARAEIDFCAPVFHGEKVRLGTRLMGVGRTSLRLEQVVVQGGKRCACAETVMVHVDRKSEHSTPWPEAVRLLAGEENEG